MTVKSWNCDYELCLILDKTLKENKDKFRNISHMVNQLIVRGLHSLHESNDKKEVTFNDCLNELFGVKK